MNTVKSVYYGWATLIVAGGGAYFFAKRSINADRAAKAEADRQKRIRVWQLEQQHLNSSPSDASTTSQLLAAAPAQRSQAGAGSGIAGSPGFGGGADESGNPSVQASMDPAPTRHEPADAEARAREKSKYEAGDVYRSRKGDRFS
ncbi:hypothetical protein HBI23_055480 [Parastagonospora nodorum]|nr:hypothetical protein HBI79_074740 [Parastagonospora nodorum]KAH5308460.1 hypothetical protein HBI12_160340 [Parastagonospora nodorum]KAH5678231.1 hypothetical protein HBI23_055480 [Parastagonospora nodorum]KAH6063355.1 hypothetical protein HBI67_139050 [Parastagonospora nodorum]KAH6066539.1 hypothetical protein HBI66_156830 [Parastagonospora nodorum]